jgi:hypothetical protein
VEILKKPSNIEQTKYHSKRYNISKLTKRLK